MTATRSGRPLLRSGSGSELKEDLAELPRRGEVVERLRGLFDREDTVDHGLDTPLREERHDLAGERLHGRRLLLQRPRAEDGAHEPRALAHQLPEGEIGVRSGSGADDHDPALRRQGVEVALEVGSSDELEHDVGPALLGQEARRATGIERLDPELLHAPPCLHRARRCEDACTPGPAELNRGGADAPVRAVDEQFLPHPEPRLGEDSVVRGQEDLRDGGGPAVVERVRYACHMPFVNRHAVGQPSPAHDAEDAIALLPGLYGLAARDDPAGHIQARDIHRSTGRRRVVPASLREIGGVDSGESHLDENLLAPRNRIGALLEAHDLGTSRSGEDDRAHGVNLSSPLVRPGLLERLADGPVICAEGYLFELERRGYLQAGAYVPEVVLDHPELVTELHREFVHAGSDVVEAFTYYAHRVKLRLIGKEEVLARLNRQALVLAKEVAEESGTLFAGDICNTNVYAPDEESRRRVRAMFEEQVGWATEAGVDYVIGETFSYGAEALLALEAIKGAGLPAVLTLAIHREPETRDGWTPEEACKRLADAGADVVGLNCIRGPRTMLPLLRRIRAAVDGHLAALPVPYRTNEDAPSFQSLRDPETEALGLERPFPVALDPFSCTRFELADFARAASELGIRYLGVCCGAGPHHIRAVAEALGRTPPASRYSADMSKHAYFGTDEQLDDHNRGYAEQL